MGQAMLCRPVTDGRCLALRAGAAAVLAALLLAGCAGPQALLCPAGQESRAVADILFGRNIGGRLGVSEAAWRRFVAGEITPRFPDGLTIVDAAGQWRDPQRNAIVSEPSKVVTIVLGDRVRDEARIAAVTEAYRKRFRQKSVLVVMRSACVAFHEEEGG
jgi:hypothetical protein